MNQPKHETFTKAGSVSNPVYILAFKTREEQGHKEHTKCSVDINDAKKLALSVEKAIEKRKMPVIFNQCENVNEGLPYLIVTCTQEQLSIAMGQYVETLKMKDIFLSYATTADAKELRDMPHTVPTPKLTPQLADHLMRKRIDMVETCDESELVERISRRQFQEGTPLIDVLISEGVVEVFTLHDHKAGKELHRAAMRSVNMPIQGLFEYFGAELGMYYAWVDCYCRMLVIPSVLAIVLLVIGTGPWGRGMVSHDLEDTLSAIYAFVMIIWASIFVKVWEREASNNSLNWTDDTTSDAITDQASANRGDGRVRPGYTGKLRKDPVTGRTEVHFTAKDRRLRTLVIAPVMVAMIGAAFAVMVFGLNITGYVDEDSPIYYSILNARNPGTPGMNYPDDNVIVGLIPTIVHSVAILLLNLWFAKIAEKMCEYQNWRTQEEFEASLILKRVPFEMLASYLSLFYLAFYEGDLSKLKLELQALFMVDTVRRMVMEFVLPWLLQFRALKEQLKATDMKKSKSVDESELEKKVKKAFIKDERVDFDDYIELTVQFGYIVLFAGAFPIAGFLALAGNVLEMRTDLSKHLHVCRRSASRHANNIGPWLPVLKVISDLSVLTNAVIFAYTSRQLDSFMTDDTDFASNANNTAMRMMAILLTEHILFVIKKVVETEISSIHKTVFTTYQRRDYLRILGLNLFQAEQQKKHE